MRTFIPRDAAPAVPQGLDLRREHLVIHEEAVREHDHVVTLAAGVFEVEALSVHVRVSHALTLASA